MQAIMCDMQLTDGVPAVAGPHGELDAVGTQRWYDEQRRPHRDGDQPAVIRANGTCEWYTHGDRDRAGDKPAIVKADGSQSWFIGGERHRDGDEPAEIWAAAAEDGACTRMWYKCGYVHRDGDKPAIIWADGTQMWFWEGEYHREDDQPAVINPDGTMLWYRSGSRHRSFGQPAVVSASGYCAWYAYGSRHRHSDLPAIEGATDARDRRREWWADGVRHRGGGKPAVVKDGVSEWWVGGIKVADPTAAAGPAAAANPNETPICAQSKYGDSDACVAFRVLMRHWCGIAQHPQFVPFYTERELAQLSSISDWCANAPPNCSGAATRATLNRLLSVLHDIQRKPPHAIQCVLRADIIPRLEQADGTMSHVESASS